MLKEKGLNMAIMLSIFACLYVTSIISANALDIKKSSFKRFKLVNGNVDKALKKNKGIEINESTCPSFGDVAIIQNDDGLLVIAKCHEELKLKDTAVLRNVLEITVNSFGINDKIHIYEDFFTYLEDNWKFIIANISVKNISNYRLTISPNNFLVTNSNTGECAYPSKAALQNDPFVTDKALGLLAAIPPNELITFDVVLPAPKEWVDNQSIQVAFLYEFNPLFLYRPGKPIIAWNLY